MTENNKELLKKLVENIQDALEQTSDCDGISCYKCPIRLKEPEEDSRYGRHTCGWVLLKSATSKILNE